jgi:hypothetical protein
MRYVLKMVAKNSTGSIDMVEITEEIAKQINEQVLRGDDVLKASDPQGNVFFAHRNDYRYIKIELAK